MLFRSLDRKSLTGNRTALKEALIVTSKTGLVLGHLVGGKGVHDAKIEGGSNAVNPAWRSAYLHTGLYCPIFLHEDQAVADSVAVVSSGWDPLDAAGRKKQLDLNTNVYTEALRKIAPDTGAYINEVGILCGTCLVRG